MPILHAAVFFCIIGSKFQRYFIRNRLKYKESTSSEHVTNYADQKVHRSAGALGPSSGQSLDKPWQRRWPGCGQDMAMNTGSRFRQLRFVWVLIPSRLPTRFASRCVKFSEKC
uniref:(northern house mosquito) hypothetical protein n=1 Tax=Culex pipiens TaxID=7175 RepID=A0A8D8K6B8_CULPI